MVANAMIGYLATPGFIMPAILAESVETTMGSWFGVPGWTGTVLLDQDFVEQEVNKIVERGIAAVGLGAEQRAFPTVEHEAGQGFGARGSRQIPLGDGFAQDSGDGALPMCK